MLLMLLQTAHHSMQDPVTGDIIADQKKIALRYLKVGPKSGGPALGTRVHALRDASTCWLPATRAKI